MQAALSNLTSTSAFGMEVKHARRNAIDASTSITFARVFLRSTFHHSTAMLVPLSLDSAGYGAVELEHREARRKLKERSRRMAASSTSESAGSMGGLPGGKEVTQKHHDDGPPSVEEDIFATHSDPGPSWAEKMIALRHGLREAPCRESHGSQRCVPVSVEYGGNASFQAEQQLAYRESNSRDLVAQAQGHGEVGLAQKYNDIGDVIREGGGFSISPHHNVSERTRGGAAVGKPPQHGDVLRPSARSSAPAASPASIAQGHRGDPAFAPRANLGAVFMLFALAVVGSCIWQRSAWGCASGLSSRCSGSVSDSVSEVPQKDDTGFSAEHHGSGNGASEHRVTSTQPEGRHRINSWHLLGGGGALCVGVGLFGAATQPFASHREVPKNSHSVREMRKASSDPLCVRGREELDRQGMTKKPAFQVGEDEQTTDEQPIGARAHDVRLDSIVDFSRAPEEGSAGRDGSSPEVAARSDAGGGGGVRLAESKMKEALPLQGAGLHDIIGPSPGAETWTHRGSTSWTEPCEGAGISSCGDSPVDVFAPTVNQTAQSKRDQRPDAAARGEPEAEDATESGAAVERPSGALEDKTALPSRDDRSAGATQDASEAEDAMQNPGGVGTGYLGDAANSRNAEERASSTPNVDDSVVLRTETEPSDPSAGSAYVRGLTFVNRRSTTGPGFA